jgi:hypothetical protein
MHPDDTQTNEQAVSIRTTGLTTDIRLNDARPAELFQRNTRDRAKLVNGIIRKQAL